VDDGSIDPRTLTTLAEFRYPKTRLWRTPNRGPGAARNFLVGKASGTFLCALDADDRLRPEYFARALDRFGQDPGLTFVSSWVQEFGFHELVWRPDRCDLPALLAEDTVMTSALVRREAVVEAGGYDEQMSIRGDEDWDLWIRLVKSGGRGVILPEILFEYRRRPGSITATCATGRNHLEHARYLYRKHEDAYRENLRGVLLWQDRRIARALRTNDVAERVRDGDLRADLELARAEYARLLGKRDQMIRTAAAVAAAPVEPSSTLDGGGAAGSSGSSCSEAHVEKLAAQLRALHEEYERSRAEIATLRASYSWRLTWPLRCLAEAWLSARGRRS